MRKLVIASDHGGFELKEKLLEYYQNSSIELIDLGTNSQESCDYPDLAQKLCDALRTGVAESGILVCGTGIGISIAANRCKNIRAGLLYSDDVARLVREHNNANVAVFGGRTMDFEDVVRRLDIFLTTEFAGGRHQRRIEKIEDMH